MVVQAMSLTLKGGLCCSMDPRFRGNDDLVEVKMRIAGLRADFLPNHFVPRSLIIPLPMKALVAIDDLLKEITLRRADKSR